MAKKTFKKIDKEAFEKLTPSQKRVAIAKDVIARIDSQLLLPEEGNIIKGLSDYRGKYESPQQAINAQSCEVCAKGALICSWVGNFNKMDWNTIEDLEADGDASYYAPKELVDIFGQEKLDNIEAAFEGQTFEWHENGDLSSKYAKAYKDEYRGDLRAIMQIIVKNRGAFPLPRK